MIFGTLNPEKTGHKILQICPPHVSHVATLPWEIQKSFSTVLFIHTSDYLRFTGTGFFGDTGHRRNNGKT